MATATEIGRKAQEHSEDVKRQLDLLRQLVDLHDLPALRGQLIALEARVATLEKFEAELRRVGVLDDRVNKLEKRAEKSDELHQKVAVVDDRINKLEKRDEESGKRGWQFVFIAAGAGLALLSSFLVQLVFYFVKK